MSSPLDEAYVILDNFEKEVTGIKADWGQIATDKKKQISVTYWPLQ